jgi:hypothetical protein
MIGLHGTIATAEYGVLTLEEIAIGLSREGRFASQTLLHWTVADHLLAGMRLADLFGYSPRGRLLVGLHDAHEAMTRDIPTDVKPRAMKTIQRAIDERLFASLRIPQPTEVEERAVHALDVELLLAEASLVAPMRTYDKISEEYGGQRAGITARQAVGWVLQQQWNESDTAAEWLRQIKELLND